MTAIVTESMLVNAFQRSVDEKGHFEIGKERILSAGGKDYRVELTNDVNDWTIMLYASSGIPNPISSVYRRFREGRALSSFLKLLKTQPSLMVRMDPSHVRSTPQYATSHVLEERLRSCLEEAEDRSSKKLYSFHLSGKNYHVIFNEHQKKWELVVTTVINSSFQRAFLRKEQLELADFRYKLNNSLFDFLPIPVSQTRTEAENVKLRVEAFADEEDVIFADRESSFPLTEVATNQEANSAAEITSMAYSRIRMYDRSALKTDYVAPSVRPFVVKVEAIPSRLEIETKKLNDISARIKALETDCTNLVSETTHAFQIESSQVADIVDFHSRVESKLNDNKTVFEQRVFLGQSLRLTSCHRSGLSVLHSRLKLLDSNLKRSCTSCESKAEAIVKELTVKINVLEAEECELASLLSQYREMLESLRDTIAESTLTLTKVIDDIELCINTCSRMSNELATLDTRIGIMQNLLLVPTPLCEVRTQECSIAGILLDISNALLLKTGKVFKPISREAAVTLLVQKSKNPFNRDSLKLADFQQYDSKLDSDYNS
ncbi:MAG: hypothetical protein ACPGUD_11165 [Parashewanella sp.]